MSASLAQSIAISSAAGRHQAERRRPGADTCIWAPRHRLGFNVNHSELLGLIQHSFMLDARTLTWLTIGLAVYTLIELTESVGL
jgi:uncharacterized membrane protein (DUF2068 family)